MRVPESTLRTILKQYGREFESLESVMSGYRNHSHIIRCDSFNIVNLIIYKPEPGIVERVRRVNEFTRHIASSGLPVRYALDPRLMGVTSGGRRSVAALYNYLPGETIPWEAYRRSHIKLLGMTMAKLHQASSEFGGDLPPVVDEYLAIVSRIRLYFARPEVIDAMVQKLTIRIDDSIFERSLVFLEACRTLPTQPLHMDLVRSNVLFGQASPGGQLASEKTAITGILDFEKAAIGHPLFDVARTLAFLQVDCPLPQAKQQKYFIDSGYRKHGDGSLRPETIMGRDVLQTLIDIFLLYDFYKFLRNTPYESLSNNRHFIRTTAILVARNCIMNDR